MIDSHCHIDLYPHPTDIAAAAAQAGVLTILVTNLPSAYEAALPHVKQFPRLRLALGLHPLEASKHRSERKKFGALKSQTSFIGEVGLDFSSAAQETKEIQVSSFRFVLDEIKGQRKFVSVHSRRAESAVLDIADETAADLILHWYTGPIGLVDRALRAGHHFSINPAMIGSKRGRRLIERLPPERVLSESDGPFVRICNRAAVPSDVSLVEDHLADVWSVTRERARERIRQNLRSIVA